MFNWQDEKGSVIVSTAIMLLVIVGFTALVVDGGHLFFRHTRFQDVADAISLASAMELAQAPGNDKKKKEAARDIAIEYAQRNTILINKDSISGNHNSGYTIPTRQKESEGWGTMSLTFPDGVNKAKVDLEIETGLTFAQIFGKSSTNIGVSSTAGVIAADEQAGNLVPIAFIWNDYTPYVKMELTLGPGSGLSGNYGFLDYEGEEKFIDYLKEGYPGTLEVGQVIETYPGASVGQVKQGLDDRIARCTDGCYLVPDDPSTEHSEYEKHFKDDCPKLVVIPMFTDFKEDSVNGKSYVTIVSFSTFFITNYDNGSKTITGYFIEKLSDEAITGSSETAGSADIKAVRLLN